MLAAAVGGTLLYPFYSQFEARTETAREAFGAFFTCVVIAGGVGPLFTLVIFHLATMCRRWTSRLPV